MSSLIKVALMSRAGIKARHHDLIVYRDSLNNIRLVLLNDNLFHTEDVARYVHTIPPIVVHVFMSINAMKEFEEGIEDGHFYLFFVAEPSGKVASAFDGRTLVELRWASMDFNWPSIVTVITHKDNLLVVDDLPEFGMQPVVVIDRSSGAQHDDAGSVDHLEEQLSSGAHDKQVFILVRLTHQADYEVIDVLMPRYDAQAPAGSQTRTYTRHQSVPFIHAPAKRFPKESVVEIDVEDQKDVHPLFQYEIDKMYSSVSDQPVATVMSWHQLGLRLRKRPPIGRQLQQLDDGSLSFGNFSREYPMLFNSENVPFAWVWTDVLQFGRDVDLVDREIVKASNGVPSGALSSTMIANKTNQNKFAQDLAKQIVCRYSG
jgi:hypothetical protein